MFLNICQKPLWIHLWNEEENCRYRRTARSVSRLSLFLHCHKAQRRASSHVPETQKSLFKAKRVQQPMIQHWNTRTNCCVSFRISFFHAFFLFIFMLFNSQSQKLGKVEKLRRATLFPWHLLRGRKVKKEGKYSFNRLKKVFIASLRFCSSFLSL